MPFKSLIYKEFFRDFGWHGAGVYKSSLTSSPYIKGQNLCRPLNLKITSRTSVL